MMSESSADQRHVGPTLVLMAGQAGAGKTTLALALGKRLGWPVIHKDTVKLGLLELGASEELAGPASYTLLYDLTRDLLVRQALSAIVDSATLYPRAIKVNQEIIEDAGGHMRVVHCEAALETRRKRVALRQSRLAGAMKLDPSREAMSFAHLPPSTLNLDTDGTLEDLIDQALAYVTQGEQP